MKIIGITGGVGAGKSQILEILETDWSAVVFRTDDMAKDLMKAGAEGFSQVVSCFGTSIL